MHIADDNGTSALFNRARRGRKPNSGAGRSRNKNGLPAGDYVLARRLESFYSSDGPHIIWLIPAALLASPKHALQ